jgi:hypothetical protein
MVYCIRKFPRPPKIWFGLKYVPVVFPRFVPAGTLPSPATRDVPSPKVQPVLAMVDVDEPGTIVELLVMLTGNPLQAVPILIEGLIVGSIVIAKS